MSLTRTFVYDDASNFEFDSDKIEISGGLARLLSTEATVEFTQDFSSSSGFTYDAAKAEFNAGTLEAVDQRPAGAVFFANWDTNKDANWSSAGSLTGTLLNGATVAGGKLVATGSASQGVRYSGAALDNDTGQTGCIRVPWTPSYSTAPSGSTKYLFEVGNGGANRIRFGQETSGNVIVQINNSAGGVLANMNFGMWSPTAGVEYEFEFNYDLTAGANRLFINGTQLGSTNTATGARADSAITNIFIGTESSTGAGVASTFNYFAYFNAPQHTANYTPPSPALPSYIYAETPIALPTFTYTGPESLESLDTLVTTQAGVPKFTINGDYWDGADWSVSDGSYAQANSLAEVNANLADFDISGVSAVDVEIIFPDSNTQATISNLQLDVTGYQYPTDNPRITPTETIDVDGLISFAATLAAVGSDAVQFTVEVDESEKYWDGAEWVDSDGSYAQSNTAEVINTNIGGLEIDGNGEGEDVRFVAFLHSDDGNTTPNITSHIFVYDFANPDPEAPNECIVFGDLRDILGDLVTDTTNAKIIVTSNNTFFNLGNIIRPSVKEAAVDSTGSFEIGLVETLSDDVSSPYSDITVPRYKFQIQYIPDGKETTTKKTLGYAAVPDSETANIAALSFQSEEI